MEIAALITWLVTAVGGFSMLGTWIARGGVAQQKAGESRLPAPVLFGHFLVAVVAGHGLFAVVTVVLVLLTALGVGGS
ncbi:hypothetical protein ACFYUV_23205 [Nonomuraea sp. NPDC003560]|uniref:hypothetical protein n=1 Tax=Nonomuraea sp. NPDC003560 TaxID=3364341 RepID=UPI0036D14A08